MKPLPFLGLCLCLLMLSACAGPEATVYQGRATDAGGEVRVLQLTLPEAPLPERGAYELRSGEGVEVAGIYAQMTGAGLRLTLLEGGGRIGYCVAAGSRRMIRCTLPGQPPGAVLHLRAD